MDTIPPEAFGEHSKRIITAKLYPRPHQTSRRSAPEDISDLARSVKRALEGITEALNHNLKLDVKLRKWPKNRSPSGDPYEGFAHLNGDEHAADCGVLVTTNLQSVVHEVPAMLSTRHRLAHVFVITLDDSTSRDISIATDTLDAMPVAAIKNPEDAIYKPGFREGTSPLEFIRPSEQGMISVHSFDHIMRKDHFTVRNRIALVAVKKFDDFRRTDIDGDGNTLKEEPFEGWYRWSFDKSDSSESWKPDGWKLDAD